jgi:carboxyl-terminal processing protease
LRDSQEAKALSIENKRRKAEGEEPLTSLETEDDEGNGDLEQTAGIDNDDEDAASKEEEDEDVLLEEAGHVLIDAVLLKQQGIALHQDNQQVN